MPRPQLLLGLFTLLAFAGMAWLSVARYQGYNLFAYDLANMSQAIWSVLQGQPLVFTTEGFDWSRLSLHVELFYFLLAPIYALLPSPPTLLVCQAALYAAGAWPAFALARRRLQSDRLALGVAVVYLLYPVVQTAVLFEFHGDTLGMPLLLFAIEALDRQALRSYTVWLVLALSCKFYVALPVVALGGILWLQGQRRVGIYTAVLGMLWGGLAFLVVRPAFAPVETTLAMTTTGNFFTYYFGQIGEMGYTIFLRLANALLVYAPALLLGWRAPAWLLPATALVLPTLLSDGPGPSYDYRYHHYALAVPFLIAAIVYGAESFQRRQQQAANPRQKEWRGYFRLTVIITLVFNIAFVDTPLSPLFYLLPEEVGRGLSSSGYGVTGRDEFRNQWLEQYVPGDASVAAGNLTGSRLVNRPVLYRTQPQFTPLEPLLPGVDYVVADALYDFAPGYSQVLREHETIQLLLHEPEFHILQARDGMILFGPGGVGLTHEVDLAPRTTETPLLQGKFGDVVGLIDARIESVGDKQFILRCRWLALRPLSETAPLLAVSRLDGVAHARIVHLPTVILQPTPTWDTDHIVVERVEFALPAETPPGRYPLWVGWYDSENPFAAHTDERSRIGEERLLGFLEVR